MRASILFTLTLVVLVTAFMFMPNAWIAYTLSSTFAILVFVVGTMIHNMKTQKLVRQLRNELTPDEDPNRSKFGSKMNQKAESLTPRYGRKYTSDRTLLGWPLVDIQISDPPRRNSTTGERQAEKTRPAKGWLAVGGVATGFIAIGGRTFGVISIGGLAVGVISAGGLSLGILSFGGLGMGLIAFGGAAIGGIAFGGGAIGYHAVGGGAIGWHSAAGGGAIAWHVAYGGGAIAQDFAVGGSVMANEVNTDLARQVVEQESFAWALPMLSKIWIVGVVIGVIQGVLTPFLYTKTPQFNDKK